MMKSRLRHGLLLAGLSCVLATPALAGSLGLTVGTDGVSADYAVPVAERLQTRFHLSYLSYSKELTNNDVDYKGMFNNSEVGALLDFHPFAGTFRLSTGLVASNFGLQLDAKGHKDNVKIGDHTYTGDFALNGKATFNPVAPYFGLGWGTNPSSRGLSFVSDIGVLVVGEGSLSLDASGTVNVDGGAPVNVTQFAELQQDLETQRQKTEKDIRDFTLYPVIHLGVAYAF